MRRKSSITSWIIAVSTAIAMLSLTAWGLSGAYANGQRIRSLEKIEKMTEDAIQQSVIELRRSLR